MISLAWEIGVWITTIPDNMILLMVTDECDQEDEGGNVCNYIHYVLKDSENI